MNLYRIYRTKRLGYDSFSGAVVAAPDEDTARRMHPRDGSVYDAPDKSDYYFNAWDQRWDAERQAMEVEDRTWRADWVRPAEVGITLVGVAAEGVKQGVLLASFNAG